MTSRHDRVTVNEPGNWLGPDYALGLVDEIVLTAADVHLEMLDDSTAHLSVESPARAVRATIYSRPTSRRERRAVLARTDDRLRDHLRSLLPRRWSRTIWSVPLYRRPAAAVRGWWAARRAAAAVLCVRLDEDTPRESP